MRVYKHKAKFDATARCVVGEEKGKFLSKASLADLKTILPHDADRYPDLLPIAGNACVVNLGNGNGDLMDTEVGVAFFPQFVHKHINLEHDRSIVVGHLTTAALSQFHSNYALGSGSDILDPANISLDSWDPFNISIGGYVYTALHPEVAKHLIDANDPDSPNYLAVAFSWEVAFDEYVIFASSSEKGERANGEIISDPEQMKKLDKHLICRGGTGIGPDGRKLYRLIKWAKGADGQIDLDSVLGVGVALTLAPAGAVAGIVTPLMPDSNTANASEGDNSQNSSENISQNPNSDVTSNTTMKVLTSLDELKSINDANKAEFSFANLAPLIDAGIQTRLTTAITEKAAEYQAQVDAEKNAAKAAKEQAEQAIAQVGQIKSDLEAAKAELATVKSEQAAIAAQQQYNQRMAYFDETYELTDADKQALAARIQGLDEVSFKAVVEKELAIFLAPKNKEALAKQQQQAVASQQPPVDPKAVAQQAVANAQANAAPVVPNAVQGDESLATKYAEAFKSGAGVTFTLKK